MDFFTADPHFFHRNIIRYCQRPFADVAEMNAALVANWNAVVGPQDTVYVLGDVSFGKPAETREIVQQLNGTKFLIAGNHDRSEEAMLAVGFDKVQKTAYVEGYVLIHDPQGLNPNIKALCGHVHDYWRVKGSIVNVGVDVWDYRPVTLAQIEQAHLLPEPTGRQRQVGAAYL